MVDIQSTKNFKQKTIAGVGWSVVTRLGMQGLQFIMGVVLARLLLPEEFGLIGMIMVFVGFANIYTDMGFGAALIQKQKTRPDHYTSIFWINIATGLVLMLAFITVSPMIARFYSQPELIPVTMLISSNFFIGSFKIVQLAILKKNLEFKLIGLVNLTSLAVSGTIGILLAIFGYGVWSLVWQSVLATFMTVILLWKITNWHPQMRFSWPAVKELLQFSSNLMGFSTLNYWARNADNLLIGKYLGTLSLGLYSLAYSIMLLPLKMVSRTISQVMFPALSCIQADKPRVARIYLRVTGSIALITFPMMTGLWVASEHFILVLFGSQWASVIPIIKIFAAIGMVQSIGSLNGNIYHSQGRTDLQFKVGLVQSILTVAAFVIGLRWGTEGVAYAYAVYSLIAAYPSISIATSLVNLRFVTIVRNLSGISICSAVMGVAVWLCSFWLPSNWPHWGYLLFQIPVGLIIYIILIHSFKVKAYEDVRELVMVYWKSRRNPKTPQTKSAVAEAHVLASR